MKTAIPFFSDFFNTECLLVEGEPYFSITGATKTLYGNAGGEQLRSMRAQLVKTYGVEKLVTATDRKDFPGVSPVLVQRADRGTVEALAMNQDTFIALLELYQSKKTKAGEYAREIIRRLVSVSMDLILRSEAGLMHEEAAKAVQKTILDVDPERVRAAMKQLEQ